MSERVVTTQAELDAALAEKIDRIEIRSPRGVWLSVRATDSSTVRAYDSSTVRATGSSTVRAYDSSTVRAYDSSTVRATGSSTVRAYDSSTVRATGSSTVTATGSSTVRAYGSSTVRASRAVAVHLHSATAGVQGGVVIDVSKPITDPAEWCDYHGIKISKAGVATVYKAVNESWTTDHGFDYSPGVKPTAPDWRADNECGGGLHFSPSPGHALAYNAGATRFVEVGVKVADLRPIPGGTAKCKAPKVVRACREVTIDGDRVSS